ncbi:hypothetical protein B2I21_05540, partial [Chryseobacterium mucoviscidosis]
FRLLASLVLLTQSQKSLPFDTIAMQSSLFIETCFNTSSARMIVDRLLEPNKHSSLKGMF